MNLLFQDLVTIPENDVNKKIEDMDLLRVEALLYTFHKLGKQCPDFLSKDPERQKEFKKKYLVLVLSYMKKIFIKYFIIIIINRLLYIGTCTQTFVKIVRQELKEKSEDEMKNDQNVEKKLGLRLSCNINTLIKDLFNIPPRFKATVTLSWLSGATKSKLVRVLI